MQVHLQSNLISFRCLRSPGTYVSALYRCRRAIIADHFGEAWESSDCNNMCDNCAADNEATRQLSINDYANALQRILAQAEMSDSKVTALKLVNALLGKGESRLRITDWSPAKEFDKRTAEMVVAYLLLEGFLKEDFHFTPYSTISYLVAGPRVNSQMLRGGTLTVPLVAETVRKNSKPQKKAGNTSRKKSLNEFLGKGSSQGDSGTPSRKKRSTENGSTSAVAASPSADSENLKVITIMDSDEDFV